MKDMESLVCDAADDDEEFNHIPSPRDAEAAIALWQANRTETGGWRQHRARRR